MIDRACTQCACAKKILSLCERKAWISILCWFLLESQIKCVWCVGLFMSDFCVKSHFRVPRGHTSRFRAYTICSDITHTNHLHEHCTRACIRAVLPHRAERADLKLRESGRQWQQRECQAEPRATTSEQTGAGAQSGHVVEPQCGSCWNAAEGSLRSRRAALAGVRSVGSCAGK